jgi:PhzF family phenazine biosynthesis protein
METRRALLVDAFTDEPMTGNPAGVLADAGGLDDEQCQRVATELGASETAFLSSAEGVDYRIRYFTPEQAVDLCGHATVAAVGALFDEGTVEVGTLTLATPVGDLDVTVDADGTVWMTQATPEIRPVDLDYERVAAALGVDVAALRDVGADLPLVVASTGLPWLLVPVNYFEHLRDASPDMAAIEEVTDAVDAAGVYAFTFDTITADATLHARAFAPGAGVPEDPVTGTASGAVGAYLDREGALDADIDRIVCEQGHVIDRPGLVTVDTSDGIRVGGHSVTVLDGDLTVPPSSDDDIIEA